MNQMLVSKLTLVWFHAVPASKTAGTRACHSPSHSPLTSLPCSSRPAARRNQNRGHHFDARRRRPVASFGRRWQNPTISSSSSCYCSCSCSCVCLLCAAQEEKRRRNTDRRGRCRRTTTATNSTRKTSNPSASEKVNDRREGAAALQAPSAGRRRRGGRREPRTRAYTRTDIRADTRARGSAGSHPCRARGEERGARGEGGEG